MAPETEAYVGKARDFLARASAMLEQGWADAARRAAYLAGFHAAQAVLSERTGRAAKTHSGVRAAFSAQVRGDPRFGDEERGFLGRGYGLKTISDYGIDPALRVTAEKAWEASAAASRLVSAVAAALAEDGPGAR